MDEIWENMFGYYGLDWLTMIFGLTGAYFLVRRNSYGFVFNVLACMAGFTVALMSGQYGVLVFPYKARRIAVALPPHLKGNSVLFLFWRGGAG